MDNKVSEVQWMFNTSSKTGKGGYTDGFKKVVDGVGGLNEQLRSAGKNEIKLIDTGKTY